MLCSPNQTDPSVGDTVIAFGSLPGGGSWNLVTASKPTFFRLLFSVLEPPRKEAHEVEVVVLELELRGEADWNGLSIAT